MITIDAELHEKAKRKFINVSGVSEEALRRKVNPDIRDVEEGQVLFKCSKCRKVVEFCYMCPEDHKLYCYDCEVNNYCIHGIKEKLEKDGSKQHEHNRLPDLKGVLDPSMYKKARETQYRDGVKELVEKTKKIEN